MKPYYQDDAVTIYHGDCREILPTLESVDLVLTDPPYGVGLDYESFEDTVENVTRLAVDTFPAMRKITKRLVLTPGVTGQWFWPRPDWVMCWQIPAGAQRRTWGFGTWQPILCYGKDPYLERGLGGRPDTITQTESSEKSDHPCPKPIRFWKKLMLRASLDGNILDPFMGSGTTLRAAKDLGRKAIGIEIEEKYCEIAAKRMAQEVLAL